MISITANELRAAVLADLDTLARTCAETLLLQGWIGEPGSYDIGSFPGDLEAAELLAGWTFDREERREHEARIRAHLARMMA